MRPSGRTVEQELARIAHAQHVLVTRAQLFGAGVSAGARQRRLRKGVLLREYPAVFRVGHRAPSVEARYLAAVCACGEGALLSGSEREARARGDDFRRYTYGDVVDHPRLMLDELRELLPRCPG